MAIMRHMQPGGDSPTTVHLTLHRLVHSGEARNVRSRSKGFTAGPVANRGILILNDAGQLYIDLTDVVLRNLMGLFGTTGKAFISADRFSNELDPDDVTGAPYAVDKPGIILYKGQLILIGSEVDIGEQMQRHCLLNGSFENLGDDGTPEFWTHKP